MKQYSAVILFKVVSIRVGVNLHVGPLPCVGWGHVPGARPARACGRRRSTSALCPAAPPLPCSCKEVTNIILKNTSL